MTIAGDAEASALLKRCPRKGEALDGYIAVKGSRGRNLWSGFQLFTLARL